MHHLAEICVCLLGLRLYVQASNFSVMSGRCHRFLGISSIVWEVNVFLAEMPMCLNPTPLNPILHTGKIGYYEVS